MRVFVIDVNAGTYYTDDIQDDIKTYYQIIGCQLIDIAELQIEDRTFDVICDDEGMFAKNGARPSVVDAKSNVKMVGSLIFCHGDSNDDEVGLNDGDAVVLNKYMVRVAAEEPNEKDSRPKTWYLLKYPLKEEDG